MVHGILSKGLNLEIHLHLIDGPTKAKTPSLLDIEIRRFTHTSIATDWVGTKGDKKKNNNTQQPT